MKYANSFATKNKILFVVFSILLLNMVPTNAAPIFASSTDACDNGAYVTIEITRAYYDDIDLDGDFDDVQGVVTVDLYCSNRFQFDYYLYLTLPSGFQVNEALGVNTRLNHLVFTTTFYNYALEAGDYTIDVIVLLMNGGPTEVIDTVTFDPPGGVSGTGSIETDISS